MADIDIFGTLNNATPEGVIARADQIKDETQNKKQSEINAEVKEQIEQLSQGGSGGLEDAPKDGKTYGRRDKKWVESEGYKSIQLYGDLDTIMSSMLDEVTDVGSYRISSPNYYCDGILEVSLIDAFNKIRQTLRLSMNNNGSITDIPYAYRYKIGSQEWSEWVKPLLEDAPIDGAEYVRKNGKWEQGTSGEQDLGELSVTYDDPFPLEFDNIKTEGNYRFSFPHYYGSGTLKVSKIADFIGSNYVMTKQVLEMDITSYSEDGANFEGSTTSIVYAVRVYNTERDRWSPWKKTKSELA